MKQTWCRVLLVLVCCVLAFVGWVGLLRLADTISAARSYKSSPAELRASAFLYSPCARRSAIWRAVSVDSLVCC